MPANYEQTARERLLDSVLEASWHASIDSVGVVFGGPEPVGRYGKNTKVRFNTYQGTSYKGSFFAFTDREPINVPFGPSPTLTATGVTTTVDLLPFILSEYGIAIDPEDVVDEPITGPVFRIVSAPGSLGWTGVLVFNDTGSDTYEPPPGYLFLRTSDNKLVTTSTGLFILVTQP